MIILKMYVTLMPVIFAGILNMFFVRTAVYRRLRSPMDRGVCLRDGRRLFGDNKTWIGFLGMIICNMFSQAVWGAVCGHFLPGLNTIYQYHENTLGLNLAIGALFGFAYVLFELPNSFLKRRFDIPEGKTVRSKVGYVFLAVDQIDSLIGVTLALALLIPIPRWQYGLYLVLGGGTHICVNFVLYQMKIRRNL